jgi:NADPH:quinone reductase-like Zn-dependent oxidoreductase
MSVIISSSIQEPADLVTHTHPPVSLLLNPAGASQKSLADDLHNQLGDVASIVYEWSISQDLPESPSTDLVCIVLLELDGPILEHMDDVIFQRVQKLVSICQKIIWVTSNASSDSSPFQGVADGLFRVLNSEDSRGIFTRLSVDNTPFQAELVIKVFHAIISNTSPETEYIERSGVLHIPRFMEAPHITAPVARLQASHCRTRQQWNSGPPLKLGLGQSGMLNDLHFIEDTARNSPLPSDKIEIKVKAVGANFRDILVLLQRMDQTTMGFECAGVVTRVGEDCPGFQVGDHVAGCDFDTYSSYARFHHAAAVKLPVGMPFAEAAAIPTNFVTAWHAFASVANVQRGETVLVHSGAGGTGQAAIQIAQYLGANVIATVGNSQKRALLVERYGIPDSHIFSSRDTDFLVGVRRITKGRGVDVVLNSLSGEGLVASWECIAPYGRFIEMGKRDILGHSPLDMYHFARNVTFSAIDLAMITQDRPHVIGKALRAVMPLISSGVLQVSSPHRVYGISELEAGLRTLQGGQSSGKVVFEMRDHDLVEVFSPHLWSG